MPDKKVYCVLERRWGRRCQGPRRGLSRPYTKQHAHRLNVTFAKALTAADYLDQVAAGVSAGTRSRPEVRRDRVGAGGALGSLLGAHSKSTLDRPAVPAPGQSP